MKLKENCDMIMKCCFGVGIHFQSLSQERKVKFQEFQIKLHLFPIYLYMHFGKISKIKRLQENPLLYAFKVLKLSFIKEKGI